MFTLLRTLSLGYIQQRWTRTCLLVVSIALGVATLVATRALHDALRKSALDGIGPFTKKNDLVVSNGQTGLPPAVLARLRAPAIPGVTAIVPFVRGRAFLPDPENTPAWVIGLDLLDAAMAGAGAADQEGVTIEWVEPPGSAAFLLRFATERFGLITASLANRLPPGKTALQLRAAGKEVTVGVFGRVTLGEKLKVLGDEVVITSLDQAALLVTPDRPGTISQINVRHDPAANQKEILAALAERVGAAGTVQTAEENFGQYLDITAGIELGFLLGSAGALVVGVFLIYNVLSVGVAERRHDIGILRSVGATRPQIAGLFVAEALALGLIGSAFGLPLGYGLARLALGPVAQLIGEMAIAVDPANLEFSFWTLGLALAAGVGTTMIAALVPALQAAREEPADAVRRVPVRIGGLLRVLHVLAVLVLLGSGLAFTLARAYLPVRFGAFAGIVCLLVGALVATPMLAEGVARLLQPLTRRFFGLEGRLAADNLIRSPGRTGLVIAALAATTALMIQTAGFIHSSKVAIFDWIDTAIAADQFVTSGNDITRLGVLVPLNTALAQEIEREIPGVAAVVPVRFHGIEFRGRLVLILAVDLEALRGKGLRHNPARDVEANPGLLLPGKASVSENFATLFGVQPGDTLTIPGRDGPLALEVQTTYVDYSWNRGTILLHQKWFQESYGDKLADVFDLYVKPGHDPEVVRAAITARYGKSHALFAMPRDDFKRELASQVDRVYIFAYAQQAVVGMVALLGVMSALLISVLQRRRELGLLRAVGASRGQVLRSVLAEAGLMGTIGAIIGVLVGLALQWYVIRILILDEAGIQFPIIVPWLPVALVAVLAIIMPLLVGIWPAHQATQMRIADAIAYE